MSRQLPQGTITLVFTDIEGSTQLLHQLGPESYERLLVEHRHQLRAIVEGHGGVEVDTQGDAFFLVFTDAADALAAAAALQEKLVDSSIRVRVGIHSGAPRVSAEGYVGTDVHLAARLCSAGHGGQVLVSRATRELVEGELTDLGEHRLKDFDGPVQVYQLGSGSFPPLRTISNTNLPRPASSFVGRRREIDEIAGLLSDGARLVTLTGPGGTGKTRLAIETATELVASFRAGVFWVPLAPVRDPALVIETIANTLGAKGDLSEHIGERELLLVVDNLEQVIESAPDLAALVAACPMLRVLATSRQRLRVSGEVAYAIAPLPESDAVELFSQRARLSPDDGVRRLCAALEHLPLAIELAAARADLLTPTQMLERLAQRLDLFKGGRDADARQQTLRATIEWSHELMSEDEQRIFRRLAVFRGGCTLEAAEAITQTDLDTLQALLDKSLLRRRDGRFFMLETIRTYAAERLAASGEEAELRHRHLDYYRDLADRAYEEENEPAVLHDETDNVRAALEWAEAANRRYDEARLIGAVANDWWHAGRAPETRERLVAALERHQDRDPTRVRALTHLGEVLMIQGDDDAAITYFEAALGLARECNDNMGEALVLEELGAIYSDTDPSSARRALERSIELRRQAGAPPLVVAAPQMGLLAVLQAEGDHAATEDLAHRMYELSLAGSNPEMTQLALQYLASARLAAGDFAEAERRFITALDHAHRYKRARAATVAALALAACQAALGQDAEALRLATATIRQRRVYGLPDISPVPTWRELIELHISEARSRLSAAEREAAERAGENVEFDELVAQVVASAHVRDTSGLSA